MINRTIIAVMALVIGPCVIHAQNWIIEPRTGYGFNYPLINGLAAVQDQATGMYALIDSTGRERMSPQFIHRPSFTTGQAVITQPTADGTSYDSYLLLDTGRLIKLSVNVDVSLGHHYFAKEIQIGYEIEGLYESTFMIYKIENPNLLQSGGHIQELKLIPALGGDRFKSIHEFTQGLMLVEAQKKYFITPDGSNPWGQTFEYTQELDEFGTTLIVEKDSIFIVNKNNQRLWSKWRSEEATESYWLDAIGDGYYILNRTSSENWEDYLIHIRPEVSERYIGADCTFYGLANDGRYWKVTYTNTEPLEYINQLHDANGELIKEIPNITIDSTHGDSIAAHSNGQLYVINAQGEITYQMACDSIWYAGEGYLWVTIGDKTGLLKLAI